MPPPRSWDPTAPSLLWAHEIRRENIHLTNQLDSTKATLASVVATANELKQSVRELQELAQQLNKENQQLSNRLRESESRASKTESLVLQVGELQDANTILRERVDGFERELATRRDTNEEVLDEIRTVLKLELEDLKSETAPSL